MVVVIIGHETTATARRTSLFIVRAFVNDTITVAVWTGLHLPLHSSPCQRKGGSSRATLALSYPIMTMSERNAAGRVGRMEFGAIVPVETVGPGVFVHDPPSMI